MELHPLVMACNQTPLDAKVAWMKEAHDKAIKTNQNQYACFFFAEKDGKAVIGLGVKSKKELALEETVILCRATPEQIEGFDPPIMVSVSRLRQAGGEGRC